jgi:hypothetical protein
MSTVDARPITQSETKGSIRLWFGILAGPIAWAAQIVVAPDLNEVLCYPGAGADRGEVLGIASETFLILFTALLALVTAAGFLSALSCTRKLAQVEDGVAINRARWMARAGMLVSLLFFLGIVANFAPLLILSACGTAP